MHSLVKEMGALSQNEHHEEETGRGGHRRAGNFDEATPGRRSSKRLSEKRTGTTNSSSELHDSGTESDEEELEQIIQKQQQNEAWKASYENFLCGASPPALSASPPIPNDTDTESWDSFGRESGIMTGDGEEDSDTGGATTPTPRRMRDLAPIGIAKPEAKYTKEQCEFPLLNMNVNGQSPILMPSAEKRRYSGSLAKGQPTPMGMKSGAQEDEQPIACRLRSNDDSQRNVKVAARRIPVRLLINHPPPEETPRTPQPVVRAAGPAPPKRTRRNSWRPSLDFEKMNQHRLDSTAEIPEHSDNDNNDALP